MEEEDEMVVLFGLAAVTILLQEKQKNRKKRKAKNWWIRPWLQRRPLYGQFERLMGEMRLEDPVAFKNFLRMDPEIFQNILETIGPSICKQDTSFRKALEPALKLAITLRYLATGNSYMSLQYSFRVAGNTICSFVPEVCQAIVDAYADEVLALPTDPTKWKEIAYEFEKKWNLPHCIGAIDGKHVAIKCPKNTGSLYYNYKGFYSIVLMGVADANYKFIYINVGAAGAGSDGGVFSRTDLRRFLENDQIGVPAAEPLQEGEREVPYFLIGDEAFPLRNWLMKPVPRKNLTHDERIYNYRISRARRVVENAFGLLANRFRCLLSPMPQTPDRVNIIVMACCCIHNLLRSTQIDNNMLDQETANHEVIPGRWRDEGQMHDSQNIRGNTATARAKALRQYLVEYVNSDAGMVPWQEDMI